MTKVVVAIAALVWLTIGGVAADHRGDFAYGSFSCSSVGEISLTMAAGALNFRGMDPDVSCHLPRVTA